VTRGERGEASFRRRRHAHSCLLAPMVGASTASACTAARSQGAGDGHGVRHQAWVPHADAVMLELRTNGADDSGGVERLVLFPDAERATWGGVVKGQLPHGTWYRFVVLSNCNHCFDAEGVELIRRDPYAREADFHSAWCAVPPPASHFPWKHSVPPQEAIVPWHKLNLYEVRCSRCTKPPPPLCERRQTASTTDVTIIHSPHNASAATAHQLGRCQPRYPRGESVAKGA
jgi:1,4-alpha-glucan branching enzyme